MRLVSLASLVALATSTIEVAAAPLASDPSLPPSLITRQTLFAIPFQIERAEDPMQDPVEVRDKYLQLLPEFFLVFFGQVHM